MARTKSARCTAGIALVIGALGLSNAYAQPVDVEFQGRLKTVGNWSSLVQSGLNWLNDKGFALVVERAMSAKGQEVKHLLEWLPKSGVLVEIRVQVPRVQTEGSNFRELVGGPQVLGAGTEPEKVLAAHLARRSREPVVLANPKDNWVISTQESRYFWITKGPNGFAVRRYGFDHINRIGSALFADAALKAELAKAEERTLLLTMTDRAIQQANSAKDRNILAALKRNALDVLKTLDAINQQLKSELERAAGLSSLSVTLAGLGSILSLSAQISMAQSTMGQNTPAGILNAGSQAQFDQALAAARTQTDSNVRGFQQQETSLYNNFIVHKNTIVIELNKQGAPTSILP